MRSEIPAGTAAVLLVLALTLAWTAGCTSAPAPAPSSAPAAAPPVTSAPAAGIITTAPAAKTADIDTAVSVAFNDYTCLDVQKEMGVEYLYPDQKYTLSATSPSPGGVNVNVLLLDTNDNLKFRETEPKWDSVSKKWTYAGLVPLAQFDDVTGPVQKTLTIKEQGKYYLCIDDRKETGVSDTISHVPIKLLKIA